MSNRYEHPDITKTLETGYPNKPDFGRDCPWCEADIGKVIYNVEGDEVCEDCFKEWMIDKINTNPGEVAQYLRIDTVRVAF